MQQIILTKRHGNAPPKPRLQTPHFSPLDNLLLKQHLNNLIQQRERQMRTKTCQQSSLINPQEKKRQLTSTARY